MANISSIKQELIANISDNKIEKVLNQLVESLILNSEPYMIVVQQKRRYKGLKGELQRGTISFDEMQLAMNTLTKVMLELINSLDEKEFKIYNQDKRQNINKIEDNINIDAVSQSNFSKYYYIETIKDLIESNYASIYFFDGKSKIFFVKKLEVEFYRNELIFLNLYERRKSNSEGIWHPSSFDREVLETTSFSFLDVKSIQLSKERVKTEKKGENNLIALTFCANTNRKFNCKIETYKEDNMNEMDLTTKNEYLKEFSIVLKNEPIFINELENSLKFLMNYDN